MAPFYPNQGPPLLLMRKKNLWLFILINF